jgi:hypothetical protein
MTPFGERNVLIAISRQYFLTMISSDSELSISRLYEMVVDLHGKHDALYQALLQHGLTEETYDSLLQDARRKLTQNSLVKAALQETSPDTLKDAAETLKEL